MDKIKNYARSSQSGSASPKGSVSNPYTQEEYYDVLDSGEPWDGGYVEGLGYVAPDVYIDGSLGSDPWDSFSNPWDYPASSESSSFSSSTSHPSGGSSRPGISPGGNSSSGDVSSTTSEKNSRYSVDKAVATLVRRAYPSYDPKKCGKCAQAVRIALEAGGLNTINHPVPAYEYKDFLPKLGFKAVDASSYSPRKGDIIVIAPIEGHSSGHIAMYSGSKWISDFVQSDMWGGSAYRNCKASHVFFRK